VLNFLVFTMPVYIVDKALGLSSHDIVSKTRKLLKTRAVGHAGTLDPLATGVLVILSEEATKLSPFLTESEKHYLAWVSFGASTPTLDAEGPIETTMDASGITRAQIQAALPYFLNLSEQLPPQYSAIKISGLKGYEAARKGEKLDLPPRPVAYYYIDLLDFAPTQAALPASFSLSPDGSWKPNAKGISFQIPPVLGSFPTALFYLRVKAGTYIRSFARGLGEVLGVPAHLSGLVRTRAGKAGLEQAVRLEDLTAAKSLSEAEALPYPLVTINEAEVKRVKQGQRLSMEFTGRIGLVSSDYKLIAVVENSQGRMQLLRVWQ
jgi:tRNA pseudouridine55 synthase